MRPYVQDLGETAISVLKQEFPEVGQQPAKFDGGGVIYDFQHLLLAKGLNAPCTSTPASHGATAVASFV